MDLIPIIFLFYDFYLFFGLLTSSGFLVFCGVLVFFEFVTTLGFFASLGFFRVQNILNCNVLILVTTSAKFFRKLRNIQSLSKLGNEDEIILWKVFLKWKHQLREEATWKFYFDSKQKFTQFEDKNFVKNHYANRV